METRANRISRDTTSRGSGRRLPAKSAFRLNTSRWRAQIVPEIYLCKFPIYEYKTICKTNIKLQKVLKINKNLFSNKLDYIKYKTIVLFYFFNMYDTYKALILITLIVDEEAL